MGKIHAIAFDLWGVLIRENDFILSEIEQVLEKEFWNINSNEAYYERATKRTNLSKEKVREHVIHIVENIYELRELDIFDKLPKLKFAIASNHITEIMQRIESVWIKNKFHSILLSWNIGFEKPQIEFYEELIKKLNEKPENILFVDDNLKYITWARQVWLKTLHYNCKKNLTQEILQALK